MTKLKFITPRPKHLNRWCNLGRCVVRGGFYQGGGGPALREGRCPICGGLLRRRFTRKFRVNPALIPSQREVKEFFKNKRRRRHLKKRAAR
jgi:hypothetical protein